MGNGILVFVFCGTTKAFMRNLHKLKLALPSYPLGSAQGYIDTLEMGRNDAPVFFTQMQFC